MNERHIVWYKRDLRLQDHRPLSEAAARGDVLPLYIIEPSLLAAPDFDPAHYAFIRDCLTELRDRLARLGQPLVVRVGEVISVLEALYEERLFTHLWAHEETGTMLTFERDEAVRAWAADSNIPFTEYPQNGVIRGLRKRDGRWARRWQKRMTRPVVLQPDSLPPLPDVDPGPIPTHEALCIAPNNRDVQRGGETIAHDLLTSFLAVRGARYSREMSSPVTAVTACSRLSPHIAWGSISIRQIYQATVQRTEQIRALPEEDRAALDAPWLRSLRAFEGRLRWHGHFMQRLESDVRIEFESLVPQFDELREDEFNEEYYAAWCSGRTGFPMVDACMRSLSETGWVNFRMRAMLVSFAAYNLWLDWRRFHHFLARQWIDYEPGIHLSQCQMQSGVTGMNALRIYSPVKQGYDHDPQGVFIRRWVPELADVPLDYLHEPYNMPTDVQKEVGCEIGVDYPAPIVDHKATAKEARRRVNDVKYRPDVQETIDAMFEKHGSRKRPASRRSKQKQ